MNYCVVTTINKPTVAIKRLYDLFGDNLIIIGDKKTPKNCGYKDGSVISIQDQQHLNFELIKYLPCDHYSRKNIGYLEAMRRGAKVIYSVDDDNIPNNNWKFRIGEIEANESVGEGWYNAYNVFSCEYIWPRGYSLQHVKKWAIYGAKRLRTSSIQQGLADGNPDVDAIWRLIMPREILFQNTKSVYLQPNTWCPFNSQSTWFFPKAYPLMYLPVYATFRCTDIWSSFIAQRCLWELGEGVSFHSPAEVFQKRNEHDLLKDLEDEVPGYINNDKIVEILSALKLKSGEDNVCKNLLTCYNELAEKNIIHSAEVASVRAWINDYENITKHLG